VFPGQDVAIYAYRDGRLIAVAVGQNLSSTSGSIAGMGVMIELGDAD
jgi:hypothetical protein